MEIGIVGLPNVGKSTLFNALTSGHAASSNYPFTTIEPNVGIVLVPDPRLTRLTEIFKPAKVTPAAVRFVDIAGLVKGASQGEGLGNQFLSHIREVDAIINLVRLFKDPDVVHTMGSVDPQRDVEVIETELILADLASMEKQVERVEGKAKAGDKASREALEAMSKIKKGLEEGKPARSLGLSKEILKTYSLLTSKPELFVGNTNENPDPKDIQALENLARERGAGYLNLCGKLEAEILQLPPEERPAFMAELGMKQTGLERAIVEAYKLLNLISFLTAGPKEVRAWTIVRGWKAPQAAGVIHTDFEKGFIRAEVYSFSDIDRLASELAVREKGLMRSEGKEYVMKDGDVCNFKFNV
ncbi:MAG: redox-regulated ATPase YchF [Elusimicrobia bacterium]|nr:redox-regulated ATPase YchF [Elusimicrobiota bacterium]